MSKNDLTELAQNQSLRNVCRVLLVFADNGPMTAKQAQAYLPDMNVHQVSTAAGHLTVKRKLKKVYKDFKQTIPCTYDTTKSLSRQQEMVVSIQPRKYQRPLTVKNELNSSVFSDL